MFWRLCALLILINCILRFATGFFPRGVAVQHDVYESDTVDNISVPTPRFDRLCFIVIDALRQDFVFGSQSKMTFVKSLLDSGNAVGFIGQAQAPTVTLPRLKALTSGAPSRFLDVILNLGDWSSSNHSQTADTWLESLVHHRGLKAQFYGDDTWLRLFPQSTFTDYDGTTSFFVQDTVEVDLNVTRHLPVVLKNKSNWQVLILHYLGLDHIGHCEGATSSRMPAKQMEMDRVIEQIYAASDPETLIVVTGDHGMTEAGNHGGSSVSELSTALLFVSKSFQQLSRPVRTVRQVDLVPTLSILMGVAPPRRNGGRIIPDLFQNQTAEYLNALSVNALQLAKQIFSRSLFISLVEPVTTEDKVNVRKCESNDSCLAKAYRFMRSERAIWLNSCNHSYSDYCSSLLQRTIVVHENWLDVVSTKLATATEQYDLNPMAGGAVVQLGLLCWWLSSWWSGMMITSPLFAVALILFLGYIFSWYQIVFEVASALILMFYAISHFRVHSFSTGRWWNNGFEAFLTFSTPLILAISCFSSSLIEEEYLLWQGIVGARVCLFILREWLSKRRSHLFFSILLMIATRTWSGWNSTGYQWANDPDLRQWLQKRPLLQSIAHSGVLLVIAVHYFRILSHSKKSLFFAFISLLIWMHEYFFEGYNKVLCARIIYCCCALVYLISFNSVGLISGWTLLMMLLQKSHNAIPLLMVHLVMQSLIRAQLPVNEQTLSFIWCLSRLVFFGFGQSNGIATVDLSRAYTGLTEFNPIANALLTFAITFGPAMLIQKAIVSNVEFKLFAFLSWQRLLITFFLTASAYGFRHHLFVWSVFSPRYLYELMWQIEYAFLYALS